jgi:hypothetical protein
VVARAVGNTPGQYDALPDRHAIARQDAGCERLMTVPGIGPIISSAMVAFIFSTCSGSTFSRRETVHPGASGNRGRSEEAFSIVCPHR